MPQSVAGFSMPNSSWDMIKRIIVAYYTAHDVKEPTVSKIAALAGIKRPIVSANNNFLRSLGVIEPDQNKLTEAGVRLAIGFQRKNEPMTTEALQAIVSRTEKLDQLAKMPLARGSMAEDQFRIEMMLALGLGENTRQVGYLKTIADLLLESKIIRVIDNKVSFHGYKVGDITPAAESKESPTNAREEKKGRDEGTLPPKRRVPIALGPERRAYIELPEDWNSKDLKKLLKMLELSLGEDVVE
jgi:hypothetical protein